MANQVYANGREISCKVASGKSVAAFPDVIFMMPEAPPSPPGIPTPFPNTAQATATSDGSSSVQIGGQEVMLKNKSNFKDTLSNQNIAVASKKGLITSKNQGKAYFTAWSMDVKIESQNAVRMGDTTTHNHGSGGNTMIPWPYIDKVTMDAGGGDCSKDIGNEKTACADYKPHKADGKDVCAEAGLSGAFSTDKSVNEARAKSASANPCAAARRCRLLPYDAEPRDGVNGCCPSQTGDHIVPKSSFFKQSVSNGEQMAGWDYKINKAPCMCTEGGSCSGSHGLRHAHHKATAGIAIVPGTHRPFLEEVAHCVKGAKAVAPQCNEECMAAQLIAGHKGMGDSSNNVKYSPTGKNFLGKENELSEKINSMLPKAPSTNTL